MKVTKTQLRRIIKEELSRALLREAEGSTGADGIYSTSEWESDVESPLGATEHIGNKWQWWTEQLANNDTQNLRWNRFYGILSMVSSVGQSPTWDSPGSPNFPAGSPEDKASKWTNQQAMQKRASRLFMMMNSVITTAGGAASNYDLSSADTRAKDVLARKIAGALVDLDLFDSSSQRVLEKDMKEAVASANPGRWADKADG